MTSPKFLSPNYNTTASIHSLKSCLPQDSGSALTQAYVQHVQYVDFQQANAHIEKHQVFGDIAEDLVLMIQGPEADAEYLCCAVKAVKNKPSFVFHSRDFDPTMNLNVKTELSLYRDTST